MNFMGWTFIENQFLNLSFYIFLDKKLMVFFYQQH
jgi:hypothetical protein